MFFAIFQQHLYGGRKYGASSTDRITTQSQLVQWEKLAKYQRNLEYGDCLTVAEMCDKAEMKVHPVRTELTTQSYFLQKDTLTNHNEGQICGGHSEDGTKY